MRTMKDFVTFWFAVAAAITWPVVAFLLIGG